MGLGAGLRDDEKATEDKRRHDNLVALRERALTSQSSYQDASLKIQRDSAIGEDMQKFFVQGEKVLDNIFGATGPSALTAKVIADVSAGLIVGEGGYIDPKVLSTAIGQAVAVNNYTPAKPELAKIEAAVKGLHSRYKLTVGRHEGAPQMSATDIATLFPQLPSRRWTA